MGKVVKKLGGQHYNDAKEKLLQGDMSATIEILLTYYDKAYLESIGKKKERIQLMLPWDGVDSGKYTGGLIQEVSKVAVRDVS